jgi:hypothetical protein
MSVSWSRGEHEPSEQILRGVAPADLPVRAPTKYQTLCCGVYAFRRRRSGVHALPDSLGYRKRIGIVVPSTNTTVQPEAEMLRVAGVTCHTGRTLARQKES